MLGSAIRKEISDQILIPTDVEDLDITKEDVKQKIESINPNIVLHLAAYTNVDSCEDNIEEAYLVNSIGTKNIAETCAKLNIPILYISTDYVFDGNKPTPYLEWDIPNPINIYGRTKYIGELFVKLNKKYWIIRTSGLYGPLHHETQLVSASKGKNFVQSIINKAKEEKIISVVEDQIGSPTYTKDIAIAIKEIINYEYYGIYHITNSGYCSWYEFAKYIISTKGFSTTIVPIKSYELKRKAKRPKNWCLCNFMYQTIFKKSLRHWKEAVNEYISNDKWK